MKHALITYRAVPPTSLTELSTLRFRNRLEGRPVLTSEISSFPASQRRQVKQDILSKRIAGPEARLGSELLERIPAGTPPREHHAVRGVAALASTEPRAKALPGSQTGLPRNCESD